MYIAVFHNLAPGGAKRVVAEELRRLSSRHRLTLVVPGTADRAFGGADSASAVRTYPFVPRRPAPSPFGRVNPLIRLSNVFRLEAIARRAARDLHDIGADVLLAHPCQFTQAPAILRHAPVPTVYFCHELPRHVYEPSLHHRTCLRSRIRAAMDRVDPLTRLERAALAALDRRNARAATLIACNSRQTQADVRRVYGREGTVCPLAPGAQEIRCRARAARDRFVLSVGALAPHKGFDFVIRSVGTISAGERPPVVIVSNYQEPGELAHLTDLANELGVAVTFLCAVPEAELARLYAQAGCFAYAPIREPLGLVILEAMAAGVPVVAVAEGGIVDSVEPGVSGLLCPRDSTLFGAAVTSLLSNPALAGQLAAAAQRVVAGEFTWEKHEGALVTMLEHAVARR